MSLDEVTNSAEFAARRRRIGPLSFGPNQRRLIEGDRGVQRALSDITRSMFAGTSYALLDHVVSEYALTNSPTGDCEFLHGRHRFWGVGDLVTVHELHDVSVRQVVQGEDGDDVLAQADDAIKFVLESTDPQNYGSVALFSEDSIQAVEALMIADERDAPLRGAAEAS